MTHTPAWREALESQFAAALQMLENAMRACPAALWDDGSTPVDRRFWYLSYHTLFWLDYYLSDGEEGFAPPAPFTRGELDPAGVYPERPYTPAELLAYLAHGRERLRLGLSRLDERTAAEPAPFPKRAMSVVELHVYNLRHVQHHVGQLQHQLRHGAGTAPRWVGRASL